MNQENGRQGGRESSDNESQKPIVSMKESEVDWRFNLSIDRYFDEYVNNSPEGKEPVYTQGREELNRLGIPRAAEKLQQHPEDAATGLSILAGESRALYREININGWHDTDGEEGVKRCDERYAAGREKFIQCCKKIFPGVETRIDLDIINRAEASRIGNVVYAKERENTLTNDRKMLEEVERQFYQLTTEVFEGASEQNNEGASPKDAPVADQLKSLYELQLMGDALRERVYGRADISLSEMVEIDTIIEETQGRQPERPRLKVSGKRSKPRPPKEAQPNTNTTSPETRRQRGPLEGLKVSGKRSKPRPLKDTPQEAQPDAADVKEIIHRFEERALTGHENTSSDYIGYRALRNIYDEEKFVKRLGQLSEVLSQLIEKQNAQDSGVDKFTNFVRAKKELIANHLTEAEKMEVDKTIAAEASRLRKVTEEKLASGHGFGYRMPSFEITITRLIENYRDKMF